MNVSRRNLGKSGMALLAGLAIPGTRGLALGSAIGFPWALPSAESNGIPRIVVEDFSKPVDPAYLSNGLIGIRPATNPLARALACVSGFVFSHPAYRMELISPPPYPLETDLRVKGISLLAHPELYKIQRQSLDMASGELLTEALFAPGDGITLKLEILQFASRSVPSLLCQEIRITPSQDAEIEVIALIDHSGVPGSAFLKEVPERSPIDLVIGFASEGALSRLGVAVLLASPDTALRKDAPLATASGVSRTCRVQAPAARAFRICTIAAMVSSLYHPEPALESIRLANWGGLLGFEKLRRDNRAAWDELWKSRIRIVGDAASQRVLDASHFYIHSSLHPSTLTGMPPYGLSQWDRYFGHSFWDTESWSLLPVTLAAPATGRALANFRLRGLENAKRQAALYGFRGAQYPWEAAQTEGFETTPTFAATGWAEQHVSPDVALGVWEYQLATNDQEFLREGTWPILCAVAEWIQSRGTFSSRGFEILDIMGPDEGVPRVNNNSYMNVVSKMAIIAAIRCAELVGAPAPYSWMKMRDTFYLPIDTARGILLPYDNPPDPRSPGYSTSHLDYLLLHDPPVDVSLIRKTHEFEETLRAAAARVNEQSGQPNFSIGFAASAVAATAAFLGESSRAAQLFEKSWKDSWLDPFAMTRELPTQNYGCFLTNYGSFLQTAMLGFTGLRVCEGNWNKYPARLPTGWSKIEIDQLWVKGEPRRLVATNGAPSKLS
jgi:hypothetical protein